MIHLAIYPEQILTEMQRRKGNKIPNCGAKRKALTLL
jgi:hypothetical protein